MAVTNFIPEVWAAQILENFHQAAVLPSTMTDYGRFATNGDKVHVTQFQTPTIADYSATRTITPEALTDDGLEIDLTSMKAFAFYVDDVDKVQAADSMGEVTADAVAALAEDFDTALATALTTGGTSGGTDTVTDGDSAYALVLSLRKQLSAAKVPPAGRTLAVNPDFASFLLGADSKLSEVNTSGSPAGLRDATIGRLLGFNVVEDVHIGTAGTPAVVAYHQSSLGWVSQIDKVEALRATDRFADIIRGLHVYGLKVLRTASVLHWAAP